MGVITLHRIVRSAANWTPGDISPQGAMLLWNDIRREGLDRVFFHDGAITTASQWREFVLSPGQWMHVGLDDDQWLAIGVVNSFTSSGNAAFSHFLASRHGRANLPLLREAAGIWLDLLRAAGLRTLFGVMPSRYHGALRFAASLGYTELTRLPGALKLHQTIICDAVVTQLIL
jgi:hypothetical protein